MAVINYGAGTYSPGHVAVVVDAHVVTGFANGTFVSIEQTTDGITSEVGADGEVARAVSADKRVRITITLQQTSMSNDVLSSLWNVDQTTGGMKPFAVTVNDLRGRTLFSAGFAWITRPPTVEFGNELSTREWIIETARGELHVGGSLA